MNRKIISLLLALIVVAILIYIFRNPLLTLFNSPAPKITIVPTATPTPSPANSSATLTPSSESKAINFTKTGNLTRSNPGNLGNNWYLTYDESGSPALNVKLNFLSSTQCRDCQIDNLKPGNRVEINGSQEDSRSEVEVSQIRILSDTK